METSATLLSVYNSSCTGRLLDVEVPADVVELVRDDEVAGVVVVDDVDVDEEAEVVLDDFFGRVLGILRRLRRLTVSWSFWSRARISLTKSTGSSSS